MRFQCPYCKKVIGVDNTDLGEDVQCGHCLEVVTVPSDRTSSGCLIADFIIQEELGRGGMGVVYLAHQISLDRASALKVLAEQYANNAEFVVGFIKEARAAAKLNHPHIVQAYAVGEDEGIFYFAMENVEGETMKQVQKREKIISLNQAVMVIQQIAEALDYAWKEARLVHRDIKPDNIMITKKGSAKLADLGLARVAEETSDSESDEIMGTPQYISPEHLTGAPMDVRSDIYSLGATFYHMITGRFAFEGKTAVEIAKKHLQAPLDPPHEVNPKIPAELSEIITKMMEKNPKKRYQEADELVDDLRLFRRQKSSHSSHGTNLKTRKKLTTTGKIKKQPMTASKTLTGTISRQLNTDTGSVEDVQEEEVKKSKLPLIIGGAVILGIAAAVGVKFTSDSGETVTKAPLKGLTPGQEIVPQKLPSFKEHKAKLLNRIAEILDLKTKDKDRFIEEATNFFYNTQYPTEIELRAAFDNLSTDYVKVTEPLADVHRGQYKSKHQSKLLSIKRTLEDKDKLAEEKVKIKEQEAKLTQKYNELANKLVELKNKTKKTFKNDLKDKIRSNISTAISKIKLDKYDEALTSLNSTLKSGDKLLATSISNIQRDAERIDKTLSIWIKTTSVSRIKDKLAEFKRKNKAYINSDFGLNSLYKKEKSTLSKTIEMVNAAKKLHDLTLINNTTLKGVQVEINKSIVYIQEIKDGVITLKTGNNTIENKKFSDLPLKQQKKLFEKVASNLKPNFDYIFAYFLTKGYITSPELTFDKQNKVIGYQILTYYYYALYKDALTRSEKSGLEKRLKYLKSKVSKEFNYLLESLPELSNL